MKTLQLIALILFYPIGICAQTIWYEIPTGTNKKLNAIHFPTSSVGYIGGNDSLLLKSTDSGKTWNEISYSGVSYYPANEHILNLKFINENVGYMTTGPYGGTYKTTDGGLTWIQVVTSGSLCFNEGLFFFDEQNGYIGGSGCFQGEKIDKMTAGVISEATINTSTNVAENRVVDIDFLDSDFGLAASAGGRILRTTDGGATWDTISTGQAVGIPLTSVAIVNDTLAYAGYNNAGGGFGILRTSDGGLTWSEDFSSATFYYPAYLSVHVTGNGTVYSGAQPSSVPGGLIFESTGAEIWMYYDVDQPVNDVYSYSDSVVFAVGDSGYVVVNVPPSVLSSGAVKRDDLAFSIFPNPVGDVLSVDIKSDGVEFNYRILTLSGQVILQGETTGKKVNVESLPTGVFVIQISDQVTQENTRFIKL